MKAHNNERMNGRDKPWHKRNKALEASERRSAVKAL